MRAENKNDFGRSWLVGFPNLQIDIFDLSVSTKSLDEKTELIMQINKM